MRSANRPLLLALLLVGSAALAAGARGEVRLLVQSSQLAGFRYHAAGEVLDELRVGDALELVREAGNPHDANAIGVSWRGRRLGYVPRRQNAALAWALDRGEPLRARISRLVPQAAPSRRIEFEVFVE
jgi:hypothetical protein